ncbi:Aldo/keto reductase [Mycena sanguinolenta]|uniref:Aldo/keto reductase n=1 Tax=Mycena sanguinolenta TaxID=230812 RepID=A0A8H7DHJ1_9AGAR|nr:Aldo/keto reductase [Mycena sanguinolenta]
MASTDLTTKSAPSRRVKYVRLGNSGLKVSQIILGCMSYGSSQWRPWTLEEEESIKHIKYAYESGIQTFDTANMYSNGMSEIVLGNAIKKLQLPREEIVIMTKVRHPVGKTLDVKPLDLFLAGPDTRGYVNQYGLSRKHILASVQDSLKRLQVDYIDLLQCHRFDYETPISETMEALHEVVKAGYVRYIGMSSCHAWQFHVMQNYAITHNLTPFISMQNHYNLLHREEEREMMPSLKHFGVGSIPWSPLARGALTRPATTTAEKTLRQESDELPPDAYFILGAGSKDIVDRLVDIPKVKDFKIESLVQNRGNCAQARRHDGSSVIGLADGERWHVPMLRVCDDVHSLIELSRIGVTAPIVGTTSLEKLEDLIGAVNVKFTPEEMAYLEEPYKPMKIFMYN